MTGHAEDLNERIPAGAVLLPGDVTRQMAELPFDGRVQLADFPVTATRRATIEVTRRELYANDARTDVLLTPVSGDSVQTTLERSSRRYFRAFSVDGYDARLSFVLDETGLLIGHSQVEEGLFLLAGIAPRLGRTVQSTVEPGDPVEAAPSKDVDTVPVDPRLVETLLSEVVDPIQVEPFDCRVESQSPLLDATARHTSPADSERPSSRDVEAARADEPPIAVLAIDTDNTFLARKFANVPHLARDWIEQAVNQINVSLELDLGLRILIGDIILRIGLDPFENTDQRASEGALDEFAQHWITNEQHRRRTFAMLLSGNSLRADYATGIAAVNSSCQRSRGYAVTQVYVADVDVSNDARLILHEVGHMLGTHHTHCYTPGVDTCFNQEAGCHSGPVTCPATGRGSTMSLCNISGCNRPNADGFAPRVRAVLRERIESDPSCFVRALFRDGFEAGDTARWSH